MNKRVFASLLLAFVSSYHVYAIRYVTQESFHVSPNENIEEELWLWSDQLISLEGTLHNDVFAAANQIDLAGRFDGDVFALARTIHFSGFAHDQLRFVGQTALLRGRAEKNVTVFASSIEADGTSRFLQDAILIGEQVIFKGEARNLYVIAKEATVSGTVRGRLRISADDIVILPGTEIDGDLVYTSPHDLVLDSRVAVKGTLRRSLTPPGGFQRTPPTFQSIVSWTMFLYAGAWLAGLAFSALFPVTTGMAVQNLRRRPGWCGLAGLVGVAMMAMTGVTLLFTVVGIPLGLLLLVAGAAFAYLAKLPVALLIGSFALRLRGPTPFRAIVGALTIGLFVLYGAAWMPYIGHVVSAITLIFGLGSLLTAVFSRDRQLVFATPAPPRPISPPPLPLTNERTESNPPEMKEG